jgi:hypothetical protein
VIVILLIVRWAVLTVVTVLLWVTSHLVADIPLAILGLALFVFFKPYRTCRWCRRGGLIGGSALARLAGHEPERQPKGRCWRCKGRKLTRRLGAYHVHKVKVSLVQAWEEREFWR